VLRSESPSGMCAKLRTVATNNSRVHPTRSLCYCLFAPHIYGVVLRAHSGRGEPRISAQRQRSGCNNIPPFCNEPHRSHVLCLKAEPGMTFTSWLQHHLLRSEIPSGMCAKLRTVVASNSRVHPTRPLYYCLFAPHICGFVLRAHSVRGEPRISTQRQRSGCTVACCGYRLDPNTGGISLSISALESEIVYLTTDFHLKNFELLLKAAQDVGNNVLCCNFMFPIENWRFSIFMPVATSYKSQFRWTKKKVWLVRRRWKWRLFSSTFKYRGI